MAPEGVAAATHRVVEQAREIRSVAVEEIGVGLGQAIHEMPGQIGVGLEGRRVNVASPGGSRRQTATARP